MNLMTAKYYSPPLAPARNAPRYLCKFLNLTSDERDELSPEDLAKLTELEGLTAEWLKAKGDKNRFRIALLKQGRSVKAFSDYMVHEPIPFTQEIQGRDKIGTVIKKPIRFGAPFAIAVEGASDAEADFLQFILHPDNWHLSGPCQRCGKYFLRSRRKERKYCSRKCARSDTAVRATAQAREAAQKRKLGAINEALEAWRRADINEGWRSYVVRRTGREGVTPKLLTRWANEGRITVPTEHLNRKEGKTHGTVQTKGQ